MPRTPDYEPGSSPTDSGSGTGWQEMCLLDSRWLFGGAIAARYVADHAVALDRLVLVVPFGRAPFQPAPRGRALRA